MTHTDSNHNTLVSSNLDSETNDKLIKRQTDTSTDRNIREMTKASKKKKNTITS